MCIRDRLKIDGKGVITWGDGKITVDEIGAVYTYEFKEGMITLTAVSYTHLDVYKRQVLYYEDIVTYSDNRSELIEVIARPVPCFENGERLVMPVSYTHLDVYKRQLSYP